MRTKSRKGRRRVSRLNRHIAMYKKTGEPSPWLMRQCLERRNVCEKVLPGLVAIAHPLPLRWITGTWITPDPNSWVQLKNITIPEDWG